MTTAKSPNGPSASQSFLGRLIREPLLHFLLAAILFFVVHGAFSRDNEAPDRIVVTGARINQLAEVFAKTLQRPPTAEELKGLIDDYVKEEIYYREAKKLGLDIDDTLIRRRLRQKMEFMADAGLDTLAPTDAELEAYLQAHSTAFEIEPQFAFEQVFLSADRRGDKVGHDADAMLDMLRTNAGADPAELGDSTLLPAALSLTPKSQIAEMFGPDFAAALDRAPPGSWIGPVPSPYGIHLVRLTGRQPGRAPKLAEVRDAVAREWAEAKRKDLEAARFGELLKRYPVTIEAGTGTAAPP